MTVTQWKQIKPLPAVLCVMFGAFGAVALAQAAADRSATPQPLGAKCLYDAKNLGRNIMPPANGSDQRGLGPIRLTSPELGYCHL